MLGNDAVYISSTEQESQVTHIPVVNGDWESALKNRLTVRLLPAVAFN